MYTTLKKRLRVERIINMNFLKKILHFSRFSSKQYLNELRKNGATIGEGTVVHYPMNVFIDNTKRLKLVKMSK